jgi:hypothetical protein
MLRYERPGQSRYEPHFSQGLIDGGWNAPSDWFLRARLADLPALCELLARDDVPDAVVAELCDLLDATTKTRSTGAGQAGIGRSGVRRVTRSVFALPVLGTTDPPA